MRGLVRREEKVDLTELKCDKLLINIVNSSNLSKKDKSKLL